MIFPNETHWPASPRACTFQQAARATHHRVGRYPGWRIDTCRLPRTHRRSGAFQVAVACAGSKSLPSAYRCGGSSGWGGHERLTLPDSRLTLPAESRELHQRRLYSIRLPCLSPRPRGSGLSAAVPGGADPSGSCSRAAVAAGAELLEQRLAPLLLLELLHGAAHQLGDDAALESCMVKAVSNAALTSSGTLKPMEAMRHSSRLVSVQRAEAYTSVMEICDGRC